MIRFARAEKIPAKRGWQARKNKRRYRWNVKGRPDPVFNVGGIGDY
jgi:hypothetical protein